MLAANASPSLTNTGMLRLLNIGKLIKMAPTLKKIRKSACNSMNGIEIDSIFDRCQRAF
jgi:hypothetical protein